MNKTDKLGYEPIGKLLLEYSLPAIVGLLVSGMYNIIDRIFIGHSAGALGIAAVTVSFPLMTIQMALAGMVGLGATACISLKLGQGDRQAAQRISGNAILMLAAITVFLMSCGLLFLEPLLRAFGASDEILPYAKQYMSIILLGFVFPTFSYGLNSMMRAEGKPIVSMATMLIGTVLNIILAPLFIFVFHWGMTGAALATVIAQAVSFTWICVHFLTGDGLLRIRLKNLTPDFRMMKEISVIGMPIFLVQAAATVQTAVMNNNLLLYGGEIAISGMGIVTTFLNMVCMPIYGINQGAQPVMGFNYGAGKFDRVRKAYFRAMFAAVGVSVIGYLVTRVFPGALVAMFDSSDPKLIEFGAHAMTVYLLCFLVVGFQISGSNYFLAVGKAKLSMLLNISRQGLILIPLLIILPNFLQLNGILIAGPISDASSFVITMICVVTEMRKLGKPEPGRILSEGN